MSPKKLLISCFYDNLTTGQLPVGFTWAQDLVHHFRHKYDITLLLHGECLNYGLTLNNIFAGFLHHISKKYHVKIVICELCLKQSGISNSQLLPFVKPIAFSVDYIAQYQLKGHPVIFDAQKYSPPPI